MRVGWTSGRSQEGAILSVEILAKLWPLWQIRQMESCLLLELVVEEMLAGCCCVSVKFASQTAFTSETDWRMTSLTSPQLLCKPASGEGWWKAEAVQSRHCSTGLSVTHT
jgi:hypothetical protein